MEFKIDTNATFVQITPITNHADANLTDALSQKCKELTESGSDNFVIDLHNCLDADNKALEALANLHAQLYGNNQSLVFTSIQPEVLKALKNTEVDSVINIAPTQNEAVDIISMEILERDLFGEE
ncbi:MAG: STAS domain-containing protein [Sphingobacteriales bacterium]|nr:MAG: STAS domain-containing protein [Sphingobacteriales bacterium]